MRAAPMILVTAVVLLTAPIAVAQEPAVRSNQHPFQGEFVVAETAAGMLLGFGMGWGLANVGAEVLGPHGGEDPGLLGALTGFAVGLVVGTSLGVHLVARAYGLPAAYYEALGGALAGLLILPAIPVQVDGPVALVGVFLVPAVTSAIVSSVGASSRIRPHTGSDGTAVNLGLAVAF